MSALLPDFGRRSNPDAIGDTLEDVAVPVVGAGITGVVTDKVVTPFAGRFAGNLVNGTGMVPGLVKAGITYMVADVVVDKIGRKVAPGLARKAALGGKILAGYRGLQSVAPSIFPSFGVISYGGLGGGHAAAALPGAATTALPVGGKTAATSANPAAATVAAAGGYVNPSL